MGLKEIFTESTVARYARDIRAAPRQTILSRQMLLSAALYAMAGVPITWDQGSSSVLTNLPGFQEHFKLSTGRDAKLIRNFVSLVYIGCGVGAGLSFFINDRIGRLWSFRLYMCIWIVGQLIATFAPDLNALYAARIVCGLGIGPLTVVGTMSIVEIAPTAMRGLLASWFSVVMLLSLFISTFTVYGAYTNMEPSRLQYQVVWFSPCVFVFLCIICSFFLCESPRWLFLVDRHEEGIATIVALRGLPENHPAVAAEIQGIRDSIAEEKGSFNDNTHNTAMGSILKEAFTVPANLRRIQQSLISYALAQLSGANSVTSYLVPILTLMGVGGDTSRSLFLSGMYSMAKFFFCLIASFFFIDALGRRKSLFVGIITQMISDIYLGIYIKYKQQQDVANGASQAAIAAIFIHGFGYAVGLLILPYVFGGELWPNRLRSFGSALSQCFHWLFYYGLNAAMPSILSSMNNWGAFIFFAGWCFVALLYVFFMVPEIAGLSMEEMDEIFKGSWFNAWRSKPQRQEEILAEAVGSIS
ncbi:general substrate transporter [Aaosphaeria arxii CBS 175.79]|uniref:General substrate transporter n=1 Tax=Aaosphaeria arxii CBS 175.79 TaxID=1450172 RepID=A0A6A5X7I5_9PLEO|nr:general substrate transporter [Aaosphaeria arxii CBS 175.79]KAF2008880.1 general substrate transporter [Aaosphaeria arxii CBS 175.79]